MKKRVLLLMLVLLIGLIFLSCRKKDELSIEEPVPKPKSESVTPEESVTEEEESKPLIVVSPEDSVRILVRSDGAPGMYLGEDGECYGFYVDLERMVFEKMGQAYEFVPYDDVGSAAQALKSGTSHVALAVPDVPDFRNFLNLTNPYERLNYITFIQPGNTDIRGDTKEELIKSFYGKRIGVQTVGHVYQLFREFKEIELVEYPTTTQAMEALNRGMVDAVPENRETALYYIEKNGWDLDSIDTVVLYLMVTTGFSRIYETSIVDRYNAALEALLDDGSVYRLHQKYYGARAEEYRLK